MSIFLYVGIDVSKDSLSVLINDSNHKRLWRNESIPNTECGFKRILKEVNSRRPKGKRERMNYGVALAVEASSIYQDDLLYFLKENCDFSLFCFNPSKVRSYAKSMGLRDKTDKIDAYVIAIYLADVLNKEKLPPLWTPPDPIFRSLRDLSDRRAELVKNRAQEKNRRHLMQCRTFCSFVADDINAGIEALDRRIDALDNELAKVIANSDALREPIRLLRTIPGIGVTVSIAFLALVPSLKGFHSAKQLASYIGLAPTCHESGTSVHKKGGISKQGNSAIRQYLFEAAKAATRSNSRNSCVKTFYTRLIERSKPANVATVAVAHKILRIIWGVLRSGKEFDWGYDPHSKSSEVSNSTSMSSQNQSLAQKSILKGEQESGPVSCQSASQSALPLLKVPLKNDPKVSPEKAS